MLALRDNERVSLTAFLAAQREHFRNSPDDAKATQTVGLAPASPHLDPAELAATIDEAFEIATTGRPGPVVVDIPKNVQVATAPMSDAPAQRPHRYRPRTTAASGGFRYNPTMSRTFSTHNGSEESLKVSARCDCSPKAFQMRCTVEGARTIS